MLMFLLLVSAACFGITHSLDKHTAAATPAIHSGVQGYCLDTRDSQTAPGSAVDSWQCNGSRAQAWTRGQLALRYDGTDCLSAQDSATAPGTPITLATCADRPGQVWLSDRSGLENPHSGLCLSLPDGQTSQQLILASCKALGSPSETWSFAAASSNTDSCPTTKGERIACYAAKEWVAWQNGSYSHEALLTQYTDSAPYEAWCADFVSYVYKEAGYAFTGGEADGWDENNANNIQNMGFTWHSPDGYTPKPGDIAYFDYDGGHVEIVISGGKTPTFIYGNSGTIDPTTGNGQMEANTITQDGRLGSLQYYLSPN